MVTHTTPVLSKDSYAVCLVDHYRAVVLVLQLDNLGQACQIALHGEHSVDDDELHRIIGEFLEYALQVFHIVVLIFQLVGE